MSAPKLTYEQLRASKQAAAQLTRQARRGSFIESETDAESLASLSTYRSTPSPRIASSSSAASTSRSPLSFGDGSGSNNPLPRPRSSSRSSALSVPLHVPTPTFASQHLTVPGARARHQRASTLESERYDSPLRRWLRWMSRNELSQWSLPVGVGAVIVIKTAVGLGGFSGQGAPPMFGDFEAQRHWMEVTIHKPVKEWYYYGPEWWQLDYPPLTAYVSYVCGRIGSALEPSHFALDTSRGVSSPDLKTYMRMSVLALELVGWYPAVIAWCLWQGRKAGRSWRSQMTAIMTILLQPALILIDNGHFQYNSVLLAFTLASVHLLSTGHDLLACVAFVCALSFKQMGLYYAPAIGGYLLGKCVWLGGSQGLTLFAKLGATTVASILVIFSPFLTPFPQAPLKVIERMFPFGRGIFEDKVANFWCASNVVFKWRKYFGVSGMARLALLFTLIALIPTLYVLIVSSFKLREPKRPSQSTQPKISLTNSTLGLSEAPPASSYPPPTVTLLPLALFTSALSFFLFSFQVHEKSILIPLMPLMMMMSERGAGQSRSRRSMGVRRGFSDEVWEWGVLINNVAVFSMWPLLVRDGQSLQYVAVTVLWNFAIGYSPFAVEDGVARWLGYAAYSAMGVIHLLPAVTTPPARFPDLFIVLNVLVSSAVFGAAWLWGALKLVEGAWALGMLQPKAKTS